MERGYQKELTLKNVTDSVKNNKYLLPALQRKFVWSSDKIEKLFDSIMQDYPINSFMFWEVTDSQIKNDFKFYSFLLNYRQGLTKIMSLCLPLLPILISLQL